MLKQWAHRPGAANNGKEGIAFLEKSKFDLVIADIVMPVLNGIEVLLAASGLKASQDDGARERTET